MFSKLTLSSAFLLIIAPLICSESISRIKRSADPHGGGNDTGNGLYNPFNFVHLEPHKIYIMGAAFVILFVFIKLGAEKEFNYCCLACYKNCRFSKDYKVTKRSLCHTVCLTHRTSPGNIFPESAFLITAGILPAVAMLLLGVTLDGTLSAKVFFNIILVPIIMSAGWATDKLTFYRNVGTILWFAIFGTVLNAAILMPFLYYGSKSQWNVYSRLDMEPVEAGLYSILICAVDPVAVLSVFEAMHIDKLVYNVVFGESLLNDGVAVVFFNAFDEMKTIHNLRFFESVGLVFVFFLYAFAISVALAFTMSILISYISKLFYHHQSMQFVVIFSLNYLTYVIGDTIKGSGILSLFFCVILQKQYVQANLSYTSNRIVTEVLTQLALLSEGLVFILMGLTSFSATGISSNTDVPFTFYLIFLCYTTRYIVIYTLGFIANFFRKEKLDYRKGLFIQSHGGLRGAIGFALSLTIGDNYTHRYILQSSTFIMVFFSVFILGATIKPLVNLCKIPLESHKEKTIILSLQLKVIDRTKEGIKAIIGSTSVRFRWENQYTKFNNKYFKKWFMSTKSIERNVSHSSVVKLHRDQSLTEAQQIAGYYGTTMVKDIFSSEGDVRLRMYRKAWNSYASLHSFGEISAKGFDELKTSQSIPDLAILDKNITRRDVEDQMTHHNMKEGMGLRFIKNMSPTNKNKKRKKKVDCHIDSHRSKLYKAPQRIINIKTKRKNKSSDDILSTLQRRFNTGPKMNKSVKFDYAGESDTKPIFQLGQLDSQLSVDVNGDRKGFNMSNKNDPENFNQSYTNTAYEPDVSQPENLNKLRNISVFDPFTGNGISDIGILNQNPPWLLNLIESAQKTKENTTQRSPGHDQQSKDLDPNKSKGVTSKPISNTNSNKPYTGPAVHKF